MNYITDLRNQIAELEATKASLEALVQASYDQRAKAKTPEEALERWTPPSENLYKIWDIEKQLKALEKELVAETAEQGTPATYAVGSDRYAGQVAKVSRYKSGDNLGKVRTITFQFADTTGGLSNRLNDFRKNKHGYWKAVDSSATLHIGYAEDYRDPHF